MYPEPVTHVVAGTTTVLTCLAHGDPLPSFTWTRAGSDLSNDSRITVLEEQVTEGTYVFVKSTLQICSVILSDSDWYSCTATGVLTNDSKTFDLKVATVKGKCLYCRV